MNRKVLSNKQSQIVFWQNYVAQMKIPYRYASAAIINSNTIDLYLHTSEYLIMRDQCSKSLSSNKTRDKHNICSNREYIEAIITYLRKRHFMT